MTWTYSGDPTASPKDEVRFLIGDTEAEDPMLSDAEIYYTLIAMYGSVEAAPPSGNYLAAAYAADNLASKYARLTNKSVGDLSISYGDRADQFRTLSASLRSRAANLGVPIWSGSSVGCGTAIKLDGMSYLSSECEAACRCREEDQFYGAHGHRTQRMPEKKAINP